MHIPYRIKRSTWLVRQWVLGLASKVHGVPPFKAPDGVEHVGFYPAFRSQAEVVDALQKIRYYIDPSRVASVEISLDCALDFALEDSASWPVPDYNCAITPGETSRVTVAVRSVSLWRALAKYDRVFVWDWTFDEHPRPWAQASRKLINVDRHRYGSEAWSWSEFAYATRKDGDATAQAKRSVERFKTHIDRFPAYKKAYVFGTGPSLDCAMEMDFSDGYRIVCNTIVENEALLKHIDPHIIVAGDAVYHYAPNVHASAFRRDLERALRNSNMLFVTREIYLPLLDRHYPALVTRTVTAESGLDGLHFNVQERLVYHRWPMGNILNSLLLPLASGLADNIYLLGFDGRAPDDSFFWKTAKKSSYEALKLPMRNAHPAFFSTTNYEVYAQSHSDNADAIMNAGEAQGKHYTCLNKTYIPAFLKRQSQRPVCP